MSRSLLADARVQPVQNLMLRPVPYVGGALQAGWNSGQMTTGPGDSFGSRESMRFTWTTSTGAVGARPGQNQQPIAAAAGSMVTALLSIKPSIPIVNATLRPTLGTGTGLVPGVASVTFSAPAGVWTTLRLPLDFRSVSPGSVNNWSPQIIVPSAIGVIGDYFDLTGIMLVPGSGLYRGEYADGSMPGWRWLGTAWRSESVGWPYSLERLVGPPLLVTTTPGQKFSPPGGALRPDPYRGFSIYAVSDTLNAAGAIGGIVTFGANPINGLGADNAVVMRSGSNTQNRWDNRPAPLNGVSSINGYGLGLRTVGRHVHSSICAFEPGGTHLFRAAVDDSATGNTRKDNADGYSNAGFGIFAPSGSESPVAGYLFDREHSEFERAAVHRWLASVYGVPLAGLAAKA